MRVLKLKPAGSEIFDRVSGGVGMLWRSDEALVGTWWEATGDLVGGERTKSLEKREPCVVRSRHKGQPRDWPAHEIFETERCLVRSRGRPGLVAQDDDTHVMDDDPRSPGARGVRY
jgi:hypothetical protein